MFTNKEEVLENALRVFAKMNYEKAGFGDHIGPLELVCSSFHVHSPFLRRQWTAAAIISFTMATTIRKIPSFASMVDSSEEKVYSMGGR